MVVCNPDFGPARAVPEEPHPGYEPTKKPFIDRIRPVIARHGGTPAAFRYYDTPPGYHRPKTPQR
jgi:hypothetical protein